MALVKHFKELRVYQQAFEAARRIYRLSKPWPKEERYALTDQIRRSSRSVCSNIAEAWRKRRYPAHFISKLSDSDSEAAETQVWLDFALDCGYITQQEHEALYHCLREHRRRAGENDDQPGCLVRPGTPARVRHHLLPLPHSHTPTPRHSHTPTL